MTGACVVRLEFLRAQKYGRVEGALTGDEAIATYVDSGPFHIVLLDYDLSKAGASELRNGIEVYVAMRKQPGVHRVIWVSGRIDVQRLGTEAAIDDMEGEEFFLFEKGERWSRLCSLIDRLLMIEPQLPGGIIVSQAHWL